MPWQLACDKVNEYGEGLSVVRIVAMMIPTIRGQGGEGAVRSIKVSIHDWNVGLWLDSAMDDVFRNRIYRGLQSLLKREGWTIAPDASVHRSISARYRLATKDHFHCDIHSTGCVVELKFWATSWQTQHGNGHRYDNDKMKLAPFLDRLRFELLLRRMLAYLRKHAFLTGNADEDRVPMRRPTTDQRIAAIYEKDWHKDKMLGRPVPTARWDTHSADGQMIEHEQLVYFRNRKGRLLRGRAYFKNSTRWMIRLNQHEMDYVGAHEIMIVPPADVRSRANDMVRRKRLEEEMSRAVLRLDFQRAHLLKTIIFGDEPIHMIWAKDKSAYYGIQYSGYSSDPIRAGHYTYDEAVKEVRRVPHELVLIGPDGRKMDVEPLPIAA